MKTLVDVATHVSTPLALSGLAASLLFLVARQVLDKNLFPTLTGQMSFKLIRHIIDRMFLFSLAALALGFAGYVISVPSERWKSVTSSPTLSPRRESDQTTPPPYRVRYFSIGGHGIQFVLSGKVDKTWEESLAGKPIISPNEVYDEVRYLLKHFSYSTRSDTTLSIDTSKIHNTVQIRGTKLASFVGAGGRAGKESYQRQNTEESVTRRMASSLESDPNWNLAWLRTADQGAQAVRPGAVDGSYFYFWKFIERDEFLELFTRTNQPGDSGMLGEFYRYVTRESAPRDFFVIHFSEVACGAGLEVSLVPRFIQLRVALVENMSHSPLRLGRFWIREHRSHRLRSRDDDQVTLRQASLVDKVLFPPALLSPGEKLIIPVEICFRCDRGVIDELKWAERNAPPFNPESAGSTGSISVRTFLGTQSDRELFKISASALLRLASKERQSENAEKEFMFGPSLLIEKIEVDGMTYQFREYDSENLVIWSGDEVGSCPFIYTYSSEKGAWVSEGRLLTGADSKDKERVDEKALLRFTGKVQLRENEHEVSFIDQLLIIGKTADGGEVVLKPKDALVRYRDGNYLTLMRGQTREVTFDEASVGPLSQYRVEAWGYYVPE